MVQVTISEGIVEGEIVENEYGGSFFSFKGIPYAEPPVGDLRFKAPQQVKPWNGVRQAKEFGPICPQYNLIMRSVQRGDEDCLYLNVYTPKLTPTKPLPVMLWIHGGAFICGSGNDFDPDFLIPHDVVLVTINYRLEILGFLCLHTEDVPGNAGMKDQVEAMRWVQRNIESFGGDPKNVTIFGESAGGASVSYHLISPMTKGLFKRAIVQSGSCINYWAQSFMLRERAILLAKNLGFNSEDDKALCNFFQSQPVESLINVKAPLTYCEAYGGIEIQFSIVDEKKFENVERYFYGDAFEATKAGIHEGVEVINGYTGEEGVLMILDKNRNNEIFKQANSFVEFFTPRILSIKCTVPEIIDIGTKVKKFYFGNEELSVDNINNLIKFYSSNMFSFGIILWQNICASNKRNKTYLYKFTCKSERKMMDPKDVLGSTPVTCHSDDLTYIFPMRIANETKVDVTSKTYKMIENVTKMWTNFAKYGDPTPDDSLGAKWTPFSLEKKEYLDIGEQLTVREDAESEEIKYWTNTYKKHFPTII